MLRHPSYSHLLLPPLHLPPAGEGPSLAVLPSIPSANQAARSMCTLRGSAMDVGCRARRRVRYDNGQDGEEDYGQNLEIAMLESYSELAKDEVLLVRAMVDDQEEEILVFKGFSSSLSFGTTPDPSKSVIPARAVIKSIDRIKGPFNPSNIVYLEKGLTWENFKSRLKANSL